MVSEGNGLKSRMLSHGENLVWSVLTIRTGYGMNMEINHTLYDAGIVVFLKMLLMCRFTRESKKTYHSKRRKPCP
jgi:hypothetical protein